MDAATTRLTRRLTAVDGLAVRCRVPLADSTTLHIGGPADLFVEVETERSLGALLTAVDAAGAPLEIIGLGSNLLAPDDGLRGVVARLGGAFRRLHFAGDRVVCGAALPLARVARLAARRGLSGLEALSGFPSSVGGAVYMNAGCYGTEIKDLLLRATLFDRHGRRRRIGPRELAAGYRTTALQGTGAIVARAAFQLAAGDPAAALARIDELNRRRRGSLPSGRPNAGSIFKNPPGEFAGRLIESCGLKGARQGGAEISREHANVIVNLGTATAADVLELMVRAHLAVRERFGVGLVPEVVLAGGLAADWRRRTAGAEERAPAP